MWINNLYFCQKYCRIPLLYKSIARLKFVKDILHLLSIVVIIVANTITDWLRLSIAGLHTIIAQPYGSIPEWPIITREIFEPLSVGTSYLLLLLLFATTAGSTNKYLLELYCGLIILPSQAIDLWTHCRCLKTIAARNLNQSVKSLYRAFGLHFTTSFYASVNFVTFGRKKICLENAVNP